MGGRQLEELDIDVDARLKVMKITVFLIFKYIFSRDVTVKTKYRRITLSWMLEKWILKV
jgi:hypothetical protein